MRTITLAALLLTAVSGLAADPEKGAKAKEQEARLKVAEKRFAKLPDYCKERRATHIIELLAEWGEFADRPEHDAVMAFADALVTDARAEMKELGGRRRRLDATPPVRFRAVSDTANVRDLSAASTYFVDDFFARNWNRPTKHLIVGSKGFSVAATSADSVFLSNAPVTQFNHVEESLIVASGDVTASWSVYDSVVVCRGDFEYLRMEEESSLIRVGGTTVDTLERQSRLKGQAFPPDPKRVFTNDTKLLGVKFYSAAEDGLEAKLEKEDIVVTKLDEKKAFAKAGLKVGDEIDAINGEGVYSLHELDRLLVRATVSTGVAKVKVTRGKTAQVIEVKLADW